MKRPLIAISITALFGLAGCHSETPVQEVDTPVAARIYTVPSQSAQQTFSVAGIVRPHLEADLAAQMVAPVAAVTKREGDSFRRGEVLIRLHAPALQASVAQSEAVVQSAEQQAAATRSQAQLAADTLARYTQLREHHSVTPYELDQIKAQSVAADAQQRSANAQVIAARQAVSMQRAGAADAILRAPFDGVVTRRLVDPGAMATPGAPLLQLQSVGDNEVAFSAPAASLHDLHPGGMLPVSVDGGQSVRVQIREIAPDSDAGSHSFAVKATLPKGVSWPVGTIVQILLPSAQRALPTLPTNAIVQQGGLDAVVLIDADGRAAVHYVTVGSTTGDTAQILSGVKPGDRILAHGDLSLAGKKIEVRP